MLSDIEGTTPSGAPDQGIAIDIPQGNACQQHILGIWIQCHGPQIFAAGTAALVGPGHRHGRMDRRNAHGGGQGPHGTHGAGAFGYLNVSDGDMVHVDGLLVNLVCFSFTDMRYSDHC